MSTAKEIESAEASNIQKGEIADTQSLADLSDREIFAIAYLREIANKLESGEYELGIIKRKGNIRDITGADDKWRRYEPTGRKVLSISYMDHSIQSRVSETIK